MSNIPQPSCGDSPSGTHGERDNHRASGLLFDLQRLLVRGLIEQRKLERVFDKDVDVNLAMDLIYGPLYSATVGKAHAP
jgi:hypothetical protein